MTDNVDASIREGRVNFRNADGATTVWRVRYAPQPTMDPSGLMSCRITSDSGVMAVKRWVPEQLTRNDAPACTELEREVRAGVRLQDRYPRSYPDELVRLVGYNLDDVEPFVIVSPVRGQPIAAFRQLRPDARDAFEVSLLRGLVFLANAGVSHRHLTSSTVYWDGNAVQIRDFGQARLAIRSDTEHAYSPTIGGPDIWAAGSLILRVATGQADLAGPDALEGRGQALRDLLDGVFVEPPSKRPAAATVLSRLGVAVAVPKEDTALLRRFEEGRTRFDEALRAKWPPRNPPASPQQPDLPAPPAGRRARWRWPSLVVLAVPLLIVAGLAVFFLVVVR